MLKKFKKIYQFTRFVLSILIPVAVAIWKTRSTGHFRGTMKWLIFKIKGYLNDLSNFPLLIQETSQLDSPELRTLQNRVKGLHSLLPHPERYQYSILIPVYKPNPSYFEKAVRSALNQSAPYSEVLLGLDGPQSPEVHQVIEKLKQETSANPNKLRVIQIDRERNGGGISRTTNELAKQATGNFLLFMDHDDWITPDLLYRYEQCLRLLSQPENTVLYCDEYKIDETDQIIPRTYTSKPEQPVFPYLFVNFICHCLLVPKELWDKTGGLRPECDGAQDFDLCLRLDAVGAQFQIVPYLLYAWRSHSNSTAQNIQSKDYATPAGVRAFRDYVQAKKLDWDVSEGLLKTTYRAIPKLSYRPNVHVIIPFRDQKDLTLRAVKSILQQEGVDVMITAVDNNSSDLSIKTLLTELGVEVLTVNEPFNFSRINNLAVKNSRYSAQSSLLLFLNNDVELKPDALFEMCRWIDQPKIGMVGARLYFPNGLLQHGGVVLNLTKDRRMNWEHIDYFCSKYELGFSLITNICDAVTAACVLIKKSTFLEVGGFDEIWYPIPFSDTDLAIKVRRRGLFSLYTPYAIGTHHESVSRGYRINEAPDASYWLFKNTENRNTPQPQLKHTIFPSPISRQNYEHHETTPVPSSENLNHRS